MLKVVLDTNVLINGQIDPESSSATVLDMVLAGELRAVGSWQTIKENRLILSEQGINDPGYLAKLEEYFQAVEVVSVGERIRAVKDDPQDDKFIEAAVSGDADYVLSDDVHLLDLGKFRNVILMTPAEFVKIYEQAKRQLDSSRG